MQNSSDILCLKEPKIGENDGSKIFSTSGTCFSKITRRNQASSGVFQNYYPEERNLETSAINADFEEANAIDADSEAADAVDAAKILERDDGFEIVEFDELQYFERSEANEVNSIKDEKDINHKASGETSVSSSQMRRNPVTGVGLEADVSTFRKHYKSAEELQNFERSEANEENSITDEKDISHEAFGETSVSSSQMTRNPVTGVGLEADISTFKKHYKTAEELENFESGEANEENSITDEKDISHKASEETSVSSSQMTRNPVTGVGLEADVCSFKKHYKPEADHWPW